MNAHFLRNYKLEEQNSLMNHIISSLDDLIFIFDVNTQKAVFHNGAFDPFSHARGDEQQKPQCR